MRDGLWFIGPITLLHIWGIGLRIFRNCKSPCAAAIAVGWLQSYSRSFPNWDMYGYLGQANPHKYPYMIVYVCTSLYIYYMYILYAYYIHIICFFKVETTNHPRIGGTLCRKLHIWWKECFAGDTIDIYKHLSTSINQSIETNPLKLADPLAEPRTL